MKSLKNTKIPAPNKYLLTSTLNKKYTTLKKRLPTQIDKKISRDEPGPTHYNLDHLLINKDGKYPFSNQKYIYF